MPNVIVTGATGINGRAIIKKLCEQPETWGTVYAVSRSSTEEYPSHVKHITTDFLNPGANIAEKLKGVQGVEYIFYAAYRQELNDQGNWDTNVKMLQNFLEALQISGIQTSSLKRIVITLGAKWYGVQFGPVRNPCVEDDPRVEAPFPPNFYYGQVDVLKSAAKGQQWDWVAALPSAVQGFAKGNAMNFASSLALYAAITKELGEELIFPGSQESYFGWDSLSYAPLVAEFEIWAALNPACGNQLLNIENVFEELARGKIIPNGV
ncbi:hypothetical protein FRB97_006435 [Tulasnella sp. 331]|nr:hypothetical protein FRB97_006435 [Tulasnella sp. 331]